MSTQSDSQKINNTEQLITKYEESKFRWSNGLLYFLGFTLTTAFNFTFPPIAGKIHLGYEQTPLVIDLATMIFLIVHIPLCFPTNYILDDIGMRTGIVIASITTIGGAAVRMLINDHFWWAIVGQGLIAVGRPMYSHSMSKMASTWFFPKNRMMATTVFSMAVPVGTALGFVTSLVYVPEKIIPAIIREQTLTLQIHSFIASLVVCIPAIILFMEKPKTPPSAAAEAEKHNFSSSMKSIITNKNYIFLMFFSSILLAEFSTYSTLMDFLLKPFHYDDIYTTVFEAIALVLAVIGCFAFSIYVKFTRKYKHSLIFMLIALTFSMVFFAVSMTTGNPIMPAIGAGLFGLFLGPTSPVSYELASEVTFPVGEAFPVGVILTFSEVTGIAMTSIMQLILGDPTLPVEEAQMGVHKANIFAISSNVIALVFLLFVKEDLRRHKHEEAAHQSLSKSEDTIH